MLRQEHRKYRAAAPRLGATPKPNAASVSFHDVLREPESQSRSYGFFRRIKRLEDLLNVLPRDSNPGIHYVDSRTWSGRASHPRNTHAQLASCRHGVHG